MMDIARRNFPNFLRGTVGAVAVTIVGPLIPKEQQAELLDSSLNSWRRDVRYRG